jgi:transcriptional regulator with XRE-family HTH domain
MTTNNKPPASGQFLRLLRQLKGVKQTVVAKKMGITQQALSKMENCKRVQHHKIETIIKLLGFSEEDVENVRKLLPGPGY